MRTITQSETVFAIYGYPYGSASPDCTPKLFFCAWPNGDVVWMDGRETYSQSNIGQSKVRECMESISHFGLLTDFRGDTSYVGPDCCCYSILVRHRGAELELSSWHEPCEINPSLFAGAQGIVALTNKSRVEALAEQPDTYLLFRILWLELRARANAILPGSGNPVSGNLLQKAGNFFWLQD